MASSTGYKTDTPFHYSNCTQGESIYFQLKDDPKVQAAKAEHEDRMCNIQTAINKLEPLNITPANYVTRVKKIHYARLESISQNRLYEFDNHFLNIQDVNEKGLVRPMCFRVQRCPPSEETQVANCLFCQTSWKGIVTYEIQNMFNNDYPSSPPIVVTLSERDIHEIIIHHAITKVDNHTLTALDLI